MFSLNTRTGNVLIYDRFVLRHDLENGVPVFWYKARGNGEKKYLGNFELAELKKAIRFFIERGSDFGEEVNSFAKEE